MLAHHETAATALSGWYVLGGLSGLAMTLRLYGRRFRRRSAPTSDDVDASQGSTTTPVH